MNIRHSTPGLTAAMLVSAMLAMPALAHHGWSWTEDGFFELKGVIKAIYIGNPHATLDVDVEGEVWRVELAPPSRTIAAGFTEDVAKVGDEVTALGNRSRDETEKRMKAVRVTVNGKSYDVYPGRAPEGQVLMRAMVGGATDPDAVDLDDASIVAMVRRELRVAMGVDATPDVVRIVRHRTGIPQYTIGHLDRLAQAEARLDRSPGLVLAGNAYRGVSINSCIAEAGQVADRAIAAAEARRARVRELMIR